MTLFTLPRPNPPHRPPDHGDPVAVWHAARGLIRARRFGHSWFSLTSLSRLATRLEPDEVLGWWPDPEPYPDVECACSRCGATVAVPVTPDPYAGNPRPDLGVAYAEGWRHVVAREGVPVPSTGWLCPACPLHPPGDAGAGR